MQGFDERFFRADDGRRLYFRDYSGPSSRTPIVCIPGLQSNCRFFDPIAAYMAKSRRVLCIDPRGRGRSDYDSDPANYSLSREAADVFQMAKQIGIKRLVVLGMSRGGLSGMLLAAGTDFAAGIIFVDIGPKIELSATKRLIHDVTPDLSFASWDAAAESLRGRHGAWFPNLPDEKWLFWATTIYKDVNGRIVPDSDPMLTNRARDANAKHPEGASIAMWSAFERLPQLPILVIRGEHSDVLSEQTVAAMKSIRPAVVAVTVKDRGHKPFLDEPESIAAIDAFVGSIP